MVKANQVGASSIYLSQGKGEKNVTQQIKIHVIPVLEKRFLNEALTLGLSFTQQEKLIKVSGIVENENTYLFTLRNQHLLNEF